VIEKIGLGLHPLDRIPIEEKNGEASALDGWGLCGKNLQKHH